jgi:pyruvate kinase
MINRKTKIIATIGPATLDSKIFKKLLIEGIDYVRINTSYGNIKQYDLILENIEKYKSIKPVKVILDIKNHEILEYAIQKNISNIAISFVNNVEEVKKIKKIIPAGFLISKIETVEGINNFKSILDVSDGIMVARGDLGEAFPIETIPVHQKDLTIETLKQNKFLIIATEMLLSMTKNPTPTRAEVSDVANAVFESTSAVMLSEETAIGENPIESVYYMRRIIEEVETWIKNNNDKLK